MQEGKHQFRDLSSDLNLRCPGNRNLKLVEVIVPVVYDQPRLNRS